MARNWEMQFQGGVGVNRPTTGGAGQGVSPTTLRPCDFFDDSSDESVILEFVVPEAHTGSGTLKLKIHGAGNTTVATDDARFDIVTEFRTPNAGESVAANAFDATPDSGTMTFSTTAYSEQTVEITLTPATTPVAGDLGRIKITRDADHASLDDLAGDLLGLYYELYEEAA